MAPILVINPNSSAAVTAAIDASIAPLRLPGVAVVEPVQQATAAPLGALLLADGAAATGSRTGKSSLVLSCKKEHAS